MKKIILIIITCFLMVGCSNFEKHSIHAEISEVFMDRDAAVTIVSDDGFYESGKHLNELAKKYNIKVTVAGVVDNIDPYLEEWKNIEEEGYVDLISHSFSHLKMQEGKEFEEDELQHQITDSINYYKNNFKTDQIAFIPPENTMCSRGYEILRDNGIVAIRQGIRGENSLKPLQGVWPGQWYRLFTFGICDNESTEWRNSLIDNAIMNKTWLIEMWHNVYKNKSEFQGYQAITYDKAEEHLKYMSEQSSKENIWIASLVDATKYILERDNSTVKAFLDGDEIRIELIMDSEILSKDIFDHCLTVKIPLPEKWLNYKEITSKDNLDVRIKEENGVKYILIDMLPNSETVLSKK